MTAGETEIAGPPDVTLERPGDQGRLIDGRSLPFGNPIDRVFHEPRLIDPGSPLDLPKPVEKLLSQVVDAEAIHRSCRPEGITGPAIRIDSPVEASGNRAVLRITVEQRGKC